MGSHETTDSGSYCVPAVEPTFAGLLFDMDGTIIDSTDAVEKHWEGYDHAKKVVEYTGNDLTAKKYRKGARRRPSCHPRNLPRPPQHRCPENPLPREGKLGL